MALFEILEKREIEAIIEDVPSASVEACRFINTGLCVFFAQNIASEMASALIVVSENNPVKFAREVNGTDILQTMRYIAASFYGMLAPEVLKRWGIKSDKDVRTIMMKILDLSGQKFLKSLTERRHFAGKRILQPIEDLDDIESFDRVLRESGFMMFLGSIQD